MQGSNLSGVGLKGVRWHEGRGKYYARIQMQGLHCHLAYNEAARALFGAFAVLNYPDQATPPPVASLVRAAAAAGIEAGVVLLPGAVPS